MLRVVSNTTPIITLLSISKLDILHKLYNKIFIPYGVFEEIEIGKNKKFYVDLSSLDWIEIKSVNNKNDNILKFLDKGEAEVILLAKEINADLVIIDEKIGREYAKKLGLTVTGTIGILLKAKQLGFITELKPLLAKLLNNGIWLSDRLIKEILNIAGESTN